ncbi:MAG: oxygen-dependent coproporphyrinogen oxidase [Gemmatimonadaceae bacterium]
MSESQHIAARRTETLHASLSEFFLALDGGGRFVEDRWSRDGGGGGVSRVMTSGATFEKAGVNRSTVWGPLPLEVAERLGARYPVDAGPLDFFASGVSVVAHPTSPMVPTVHFNARYFEVTSADGRMLDAWHGGGTDLTPYYPHWHDAHEFHVALHAACNRFHPTLYARFKGWCDAYFVNVHRGNEARGVGGVFYDHLRPREDESGLGSESLFDLGAGIAEALRSAYALIVGRRRDESFGEREVHFQRLRRGRYVEFNLVHDRGTLFGLQTGARIESVLMSLPPEARWDYGAEPAPGSREAEFMEMLAPRDWLAWTAPPR